METENRFWEKSTGRKLTKEQREEIVTRYLAGELAETLSNEFGITRSNVGGLARRRGLKKQRGKLTFQQKTEVKKRYAEGETSVALASAFNVTHNAINAIIRRAGMAIQDRKTLPLDHCAFSEITPESAYWIGFLMADGSVSDNYITLQLAEKDKDHVYKFREFLKSGHKMMIIPAKIANASKRILNSTKAYKFTVSSSQIASDLARYGVVPRKSLTAKVISLENNRDFWRGVVDGDGSVRIDKMRKKDFPIISLCGSKFIVEQFKCYMVQNTGSEAKKITKAKKNEVNSIFTIAANGKYAVKLAEILYKDATVFLDRKYQTAMKILSQ